ncbi:zinc finger protein 572-like [Antennarius striatus]|uniref:zinc finger protein 572-like n=1 Tax=Antennarius striatus TaxID=241820 RepID=UPI0035AE9BB3
MSKGQMLRALVKQRLTAAAEEIFGLFERTIAEYEEELCRSKEENERQRELLDAVFKPQLRIQKTVFPTDVRQLVSEEERPHEQQDIVPGLDQEEQPELPDIKEEQEELWTNQEAEQLQELEENELTFTPLLVKKEYDDDDEEHPLFWQSPQIEQMKTYVDSGGPDPARSSDPDGHFRPDSDHNTSEKPFRCSECERRFRHKGHLQIHMRCHTGEKPFSCSVCGKSFPRKENLVRHARFHSGEKPFSCSFCKKRFTRSDHAITHMRTHTGEKPFSCSVCWKRFSHNVSLKHHMTVHREETV